VPVPTSAIFEIVCNNNVMQPGCMSCADLPPTRVVSYGKQPLSGPDREMSRVKYTWNATPEERTPPPPPAVFMKGAPGPQIADICVISPPQERIYV
jgi:hypothetical protein